MADLGTNVRYIKGIGEVRANALEKLGIVTLGDLISYFPRGYEDRTAVRPIRELTAGECVCVRGMVAADPTPRRIAGGRTLVKTRVVDDSGSMDLVFFNAQHLGSSLHMGETYVFFGRVEDDLRHRQMINPLFEPEGRQQVTGRIMPIYPPDRRSDPGAYGPGSPAGAGRLPGAAAGCAARRHPPGPQPVLCELRL